ncbi:hypothetical protein F511_11208 [Dorcoceras hygrometricum]|uniref:Uncharacterized protein n=1 Tax=Dorcoceras hygrometricum TaxID=472368 RepID=A0A2Z7CXX0_9LAMI|nr:hypothetical protein F511_11208 [Dorcoceras hygrometricum]
MPPVVTSGPEVNTRPASRAMHLEAGDEVQYLWFLNIEKYRAPETDLPATGSTVARDWYINLRLDAYQQLVVQTLVVKCLRLDYPTIARRQNAVVSINPNDIVLLSLTSSTNCWLHCSSLLIADVTADLIIAEPTLALLCQLLIVMTSLLMSSSLIPDLALLVNC